VIKVRVCDKDAEKIIRHSDMYDYLGDDGSPPRKDFELVDVWTNLVAYIGKQPAAFMCVAQVNHVTSDIHFGVHPDYRKHSSGLGRALLKWVWENTNNMKLVAQTHAEVVTDFALSMGFEIEGINTASFMKNGELMDQTYLGVKRCLPQQ
jgi:hypothetical protein